MDPSSLAAELADGVEFVVEVIDARQSAEKAGSSFEQLCQYYRAMGICLLSSDADTDGFFHYLIQSALTRRHYLTEVAAVGGGETLYRRASFLDPIFDAIAARQWALAGALFDLGAQTWSEGDEYEDDFCYAAAIRQLVTGADAAMEPLLSRWEDVLEGGTDLRLSVVRALAARDPAEFAASLRSFLNARDETARELADPVNGSLLAHEITFFPNRWIAIEGLALLAIAERLALVIEGEFIGCPPLARDATFARFVPRGFPDVSFSIE